MEGTVTNPVTKFRNDVKLSFPMEEEIKKTTKRQSKARKEALQICYKQYASDWFDVDHDVARIMDALPGVGPIPFDLFFDAITACVNINNRILAAPSACIVEVEVDGKRYLHVDPKRRQLFFYTWREILANSDKWFNLQVGMDMTGVIQSAYSVNAVAMGTSAASKKFEDEKRCTPTVTFNLTKQQEATLMKEVDCKIQFTPTRMSTSDHPLLASCRELARQSYEHQFRVRGTQLNTLVVGAAWREVSMYSGNNNFSFYFALKDAKDVSRVNVNALEYVKGQVTQGLAKAKAGLTKRARKSVEGSRLRMRAEGIQGLLKAAKEEGKIDSRFYIELPEHDPDSGRNGFDQLVCEDVGYNFSGNDWLDLFEKTNAERAVGYMFLPYELIFDNMAPNNMYMYRERLMATTVTGITEMSAAEAAATAVKLGVRESLVPERFKSTAIYSQVAFPGHSNGYSHKKTNWATLLKENVISRPGYDFSLCCELTSRIGPMVTFTMVRVTSGTSTVRYLALPPNHRFVRVLDIMQLLKESRRLRSRIDIKDYPYFSMRQEEWTDLVNYGASLDEKSTTIQNLIVYTRRRCGGASLVSKELIPAWSLHDDQIIAAAQAAYYYIRFLRERIDLADSTIMRDKGSWWRKLLDVLAQPLMMVAGMVSLLWSWMYSHGIVERIVMTPEMGIWQDSEAIIMAPSKKPRCYTIDEGDLTLGEQIVNEEASETDDEVPITCDLCSALAGKLGDQNLICDHKEPTFHEFALDDSQLSALRAKLMDTDNDPPGLGAVKKECRSKLPVAGFSHTARVHYIMGGPGAGKSYLIRTLAKLDDCVMAPFSKLKADYENVTTADGYEKDLAFKTPHRAVCEAGRAIIFVDEFPAFPYELLACAVANCAARTVYLVGDIKQTKIREPDEGMCAVNHIDFANVQTHTLEKNFRNPKDAVTLLNDLYGYSMVAASTRDCGFFHDDIANLGSYQNGYSVMTYTEMAGLTLGFEEKNTVRKNQGGTFDKVALVLTAGDEQLMKISDLTIVALSRHKKECVFLHDGSSAARNFLVKLGLIDVNLMMQITGKPFGQMGRHKCEYVKPVSESDLIIASSVVFDAVNKGKEVVIDIPSSSGSTPNLDEFLEEGTTTVKVVEYEEYALNYKHGDFCTLSDLSAKGDLMGSPSVDKERWGPLVVLCVNAEDLKNPANVVKLEGFVHTGLELVVLSDEAKAVSSLIEQFQFNRDFYDHTTIFVGDVRTVATIENHVEEPTFEVVKSVHPSYDAYLLIQEEVNAGRLEYNVSYLNEETSNVIKDDFNGGVMSTEIISPVNSRGHPVSQEKTTYRFCLGASYQYYAGNEWQVLQCLQSRYLIKAASALFSAQGKAVAISIADRFVNECMDSNYDAFRQEDISTIVTNAYRGMVAKNYQGQTDLTDGGTRARTFRFNLKEIDKPVKNAIDLFKAGQGISAWSKEAHTLFCLGFRIMNRALINGLKRNVIYDNGLSEEEVMHQVGQVLSDTPEVAVNAVIDAAACDSGQNEFTMAIERRIYERIGVSEEFLDWYFSFRESYKLDSGYIKAMVKYVKTSGEPGTLLGNTILMMALMNSILRGEGPFAMVGKGDDGLKRQANMRYDENLVAMVGRQCPLQFKVDIDVPVQFCGYALAGNQLVPCILRKLIKCGSHNFAGYDKFTEYQTSLRDWTRRVEMLIQHGVPVIATNCKIYAVEPPVAETWLQIISSLSHINREQFNKIARKFTARFEPPVFDHTLPSHLFQAKYKTPFTEI